MGAAGGPRYCTGACRLAHKQLQQQQHRRQAEQRRRQHKAFASHDCRKIGRFVGAELIVAVMEHADVRQRVRGL